MESRVKRGTELSIDRHVAVSRIGWWGRLLGEPGRPKYVTRQGCLCLRTLSGTICTLSIFVYCFFSGFDFLTTLVSSVAQQLTNLRVQMVQMGLGCNVRYTQPQQHKTDCDCYEYFILIYSSQSGYTVTCAVILWR